MSSDPRAAMRANAESIIRRGEYLLAFNAGRIGFGDDTRFPLGKQRLSSRELVDRFERSIRWAELRKPRGDQKVVVVYLHGQDTFDDMAGVKRMRWFQQAIETGDRHVGCIEWDRFLKVSKRTH